MHDDRRVGRWLLAPPVALVALLIVWPAMTILARGFGRHAWSGLDGTTVDIVVFTVWQAVVSALLATALGIGPGLWLATLQPRRRRLASALVTIPFLLPTVASGTAMLAVLPNSWHRTVPGLLVAHVWVNIGLVTRLVAMARSRIDPRLVAAAATLGAGPFHQFIRIVWPQIRLIVAAGASACALFCIGSFGLARLVGGPANPTIEVEIWRRATQLVDLEGAATLSIIQVSLFVAAAVVAVVTGLRLRGSSDDRAAERSATPFVARIAPPRPRTVLASWGFVGLMMVPIGALVIRSVRPSIAGYGFDAWRALARGTTGPNPAGRPSLIGSLVTSFATAAVAAVIALFLGTLASLGLARLGLFSRTFGNMLFSLPLSLSSVTVGLGLLITFDRGVLDWRGSWLMVPLGQAMVALPVVLRLTDRAIRSIRRDMRAAGATLGASSLRRVWSLDLPIARRALGGAGATAFAVSVGEFGASSLLTRTGSPTAPVAIATLLGRPSTLNLATASALACALAAATAVAAMLVEGVIANDG